MRTQNTNFPLDIKSFGNWESKKRWDPFSFKPENKCQGLGVKLGSP